MDLSKNSIAALGRYGISRRTLLRGVGAFTAFGAVSPLIAACGSDEDEPDEPGPASGTTDNTPLPEAEPTSPASPSDEPTTDNAAAEG